MMWLNISGLTREGAKMENLSRKLRELPGSRGFRLFLLGLLVVVIYPQARLLWVKILAIAYFWPIVEALFISWEKEDVLEGYNYAKKKLHFFPFVIVTLVLVYGLFFYAQWDLHQTRLVFDEFRSERLKNELSFERGKAYRGESYGLRGPVIIDVSFEDNKIYDDPKTKGIDGIKLVKHSDSVSVGRAAMDIMARRMYAASHANPAKSIADVDGISGASYSSKAIREAVIDAIYREKGQRHITAPTKALFWLIGNDLSRFAFSASAIIFIIGLLFEFTLAPFIRRGAGVTLPCYNCQTCVGVCPVKIIDGQPYPMTMVLETRAGNYERAAVLGQYCVGCSKCASRCPVGISGPIVASEARRMAREDRKAKEVS